MPCYQTLFECTFNTCAMQSLLFCSELPVRLQFLSTGVLVYLSSPEYVICISSDLLQTGALAEQTSQVVEVLALRAERLEDELQQTQMLMLAMQVTISEVCSEFITLYSQY